MKPGMLLVSAIPPFPATSGGATRMYYTLKYLSQKYTLYFLTYGDDITSEPEKKFLDETCAFWQVFPLQKRTLLTTLPHYFSCWKNEKLERQLGKILDEHEISKIRIEFTQIAYLRQYLPREIPNNFVAHDISTTSFARREASFTGSRYISDWIQMMMDHASKIEIHAFEKMWLPLYDEVAAVSRHDADELRAMFSLKNVRVEANGLPATNFVARRQTNQLTIGYIGSSLHLPNKVAIDFTINEILPRLSTHVSDLQYLLAGTDHARAETNTLKLLGQVDNVQEFYEQIDILVAPLFAGSGTRIKILESLSFGIPVVTTSIGAEGLEIRSPLLQICDAPDKTQLADAMVQKILEIKHHYQNYTSDKVRRDLQKQLTKYLWSETFRYS